MSAQPGERDGAISAVGRVTLLVGDLDEALDWYRSVLGFEVIHDSVDGGFRYLHVGAHDQDGVGLWLFPALDGERIGAQTGGEPLLVLYARDLDQVIVRLEAHGVEHWNVRDDGDSRSLHLRDLVGNVLVVAELSR